MPVIPNQNPIESLKQEIDKLTARKNELQAELGLYIDYKMLNDALEHHKINIELEKSKLDEEYESRMSRLQVEIDSVVERKERLSKQVKSLERKLLLLTEDINSAVRHKCEENIKAFKIVEDAKKKAEKIINVARKEAEKIIGHANAKEIQIADNSFKLEMEFKKLEEDKRKFNEEREKFKKEKEAFIWEKKKAEILLFTDKNAIEEEKKKLLEEKERLSVLESQLKDKMSEFGGKLSDLEEKERKLAKRFAELEAKSSELSKREKEFEENKKLFSLAQRKLKDRERIVERKEQELKLKDAGY